MPIRRSPRLTPRSLAARRANALKSTGPRTPCGKARVSLNALKHGRSMGPAGRAPRFRERLLRAGYPYKKPSTETCARVWPRLSLPGALTGGVRWTNSRPRRGV